VYATNGAISAAYIAENIATMSANDPADATDFVARQTEQAAEYATSSAIAATLTTRNATCEHGYDYPFNYYPGELFTTNSGENWAVIECVPDETNSLNGYTEVVNYDGSKVFRIPLATGQF